MSQDLKDRKDSAELEEFIKALQRPHRKDGTILPDIHREYTRAEYQGYFNKKRENTQSSPSIHIGHHKAAAECDFLSTVNALFIDTPFRNGFALSKWTEALQCILQKKEQPLWNRLRIITLFEADLNAGAGFFLARLLLYHAEEHGVTDSQNAGSKPERTIFDPLYIQTITYDITRLLRQDLDVIYNDAVSCYDRIRPNLQTICYRRLGCPPKIASTKAKCMVDTKYQIKTGHGITTEYILPDKKRGGIGQGSTDGPQGWNAHLEPLTIAFEHFTTGFQFCSPTNQTRFKQILASIVDDVTILRNGFYAKTMKTRIQQFTDTIRSWQRLLRITGGDISTAKSLAYIVSFLFDKTGDPRMATMIESPCKVISSEEV